MDFPTSITYQKIIEQSPWSILIESVINYLSSKLKPEAKLIDCFCGPGYILEKLYIQRNDLSLTGIDSNQDFIKFAKQMNSNIKYINSDFFDIKTTQEFDAVICTGGLHHVKNKLKQQFLSQLFKLKGRSGIVIVGDPYLDSYRSEKERVLASITLGQAYLKEAVQMNAENTVLKELINIMDNDIFYSEYKLSLVETERLIECFTKEYEVVKTWPDKDSEYGDYYFICK